MRDPSTKCSNMDLLHVCVYYPVLMFAYTHAFLIRRISLRDNLKKNEKNKITTHLCITVVLRERAVCETENLIALCQTDTYFLDLETGGKNSCWLLDRMNNCLSICLYKEHCCAVNIIIDYYHRFTPLFPA